MNNTGVLNGRKFNFWDFQIVDSIECSHETANCGYFDLEELELTTEEDRTPFQGCAKTLLSRLGRRNAPSMPPFKSLLPVITAFEKVQTKGGTAQ